MIDKLIDKYQVGSELSVKSKIAESHIDKYIYVSLDHLQENMTKKIFNWISAT